jgi:hypothetical protein
MREYLMIAAVFFVVIGGSLVVEAVSRRVRWPSLVIVPGIILLGGAVSVLLVSFG